MPPTVLPTEWPVNIYKACTVFVYIPQAGACFDMGNKAKRLSRYLIAMYYK